MKNTQPIGKYLSKAGSPSPKYKVTLKGTMKGNPRGKKLA